MIYVGVVGHLLDIDPAEMEIALTKQFKGKAKAVALEQDRRSTSAASSRRENLDRNLVPYRCERDECDKGQNHHRRQCRSRLGCMFAGVTVATWYPITPSSSLCETLGRLHEGIPYRERRQSELRHRAGRRRTRRGRHGDSAPAGPAPAR